MKRHPSLASLSRDHHHALVLARRARSGALAPREAVLELERALAPHFELEERLLVPRCDALGEPLASQAARVVEDHAALRRLASELTTEGLDAFGERLEAHVRYEERTWFPSLEQHMGPEALARLSASLGLGRMPRLPHDVTEYKRTSELDAATVPAGLTRNHTTKAGVWAEIVVIAGRLLYVLEDEGDDAVFVLDPDTRGVIEPERPHRVAPEPGARFYVRFLRSSPSE